MDLVPSGTPFLARGIVPCGRGRTPLNRQKLPDGRTLRGRYAWNRFITSGRHADGSFGHIGRHRSEIVAKSDPGPQLDPVRDLESRQDEVLRQLGELEQRLALLLESYAPESSAGKKAA